MHNKISAGLKAIADAEASELDKLVAILQAMLIRPTKLAGYAGTPAGSMDDYVEGGKLFESGVLEPGTWDGFSQTGWTAIANQAAIVVTAINSGALQCLRIEDMEGKAYFEANAGTYTTPEVFDFNFTDTSVVAGKQYQFPAFFLQWGFTP